MKFKNSPQNIVCFRTLLIVAPFLLVGTLLSACGGGGGSDSSPTPNPPIPNPGTSGPRNLTLKGNIENETLNSNGTRDPVVGYTVCSFGECSVSDAKGDFLFSTTAPAGADEIEYTVTGGSFLAKIEFPLRPRAEEVQATFLKPEGQNLLEIGVVAFDGVVDETISPAGFNDGD